MDSFTPDLVVNNVASTDEGARTYQFQIGRNAEFTGETTVEIVPEGSGGTTTYRVPQPLSPEAQYFWRVRAVHGSAIGSWAAARFTTRGNGLPRVSLVANTNRVEVDDEVIVTATVEDDETPLERLRYEWSALAGRFIGEGTEVRWEAPGGGRATPADYDLTLTVIEQYEVTNPDGSKQARENRASASVKVYVNDSDAEITDLVMTFLDDFTDSSVPPAHCVRNFSDSCGGKQEELKDIEFNRRTFVVLGGSYSVANIAYSGNRLSATIDGPCQFRSRVIATGRVEQVTGQCVFRAVYEDMRWWLCDSSFLCKMGDCRNPLAPFTF